MTGFLIRNQDNVGVKAVHIRVWMLPLSGQDKIFPIQLILLPYPLHR